MRALLLEDERDLRELMGELLDAVKIGRPCVSVGSVSEMIARSGEALSCEVAVLDVNLGPGVPSGLDAYRWLRQQGFHGRVVFLTGHASTHPLVRDARNLPDVLVLEKPVEVAELEALAHH